MRILYLQSQPANSNPFYEKNLPDYFKYIDDKHFYAFCFQSPEYVRDAT